MEFAWMNYSSSTNRDNIYGRSNDSGMKDENLSKISEKSLTSNIVNFGYYVD
jgi:hypothetical protein